MKNVKKMLLIGVLATASIIGSGCSKSDTSTGSTATSETTAKESKVEETTKKTAQKNKFEYPITLGTIGGMDLMADREFPKAGFFPAVIVDNSEKVSYNGVDFIKEEGHIDITRKDPSNTYSPELVRSKYIAYYYFSPEGAGSNPADDNQGYGMGMAIWGVRPVDMSDETEAKTMEENYEKLKKSTKASMETLISLDDYWKLTSQK